MLLFLTKGCENMITDFVKVYVKAGNGGNGCVSFHREKFVSHGGPDGGDGGNGGNIILRIENGDNTLLKYKYRHKFIAKNGEDGKTNKFHGANGEDIILPVPPGTVVKDAQSGAIIVDMSERDDFVLCKGGKGGWGNRHFATPTRQIPRFAKNGLKGDEKEVIFELKMLADVALIGLPNVGKSSLLSQISSAQPKIADYEFTTLSPNLGVVKIREGKGFVVADIPGLIEGASQGIGLGHEFLRHIERTKMMIHVVDAASSEGRDPIDDIYKINAELEAYNPEIAKRPQVIAANKTDLIYAADEDPVEKIRAEFEPQGIKVFAISGVSGDGIKELLYYVNEQLKTLDRETIIFEQEYFPEEELILEDLPYTVTFEDDMYVVEGPKIEKMLGYTNLDSEKGFAFFQKFLKDGGILDELEAAGIQEGDTVRMYGLQFDYYK